MQTPSSASPWFGAAWLTVTTIVMLLPLLPSLRELFSGSDADALSIDHLDNGRTDYAAGRAISRLPDLYKVRGVENWSRDDHGVLMIPRKQSHLRVRTTEPVVLGMRSRVRILVSSNMVELHSRSRVTSILHARSIRSLGPARLAPMTSARRHIMLAGGTRFERVSAGCVYTWPFQRAQHVILGESRDRKLTREHHRHEGDLRIPVSAKVTMDLVVTGSLYLEEGAVIQGHVKVHGSVRLARGACVEGALFALGDIQTAGDNYVAGPISADHLLRIGSGSQVGSHSMATSASAYIVELEPSVRVYGSLSALRTGIVVEA